MALLIKYYIESSVTDYTYTYILYDIYTYK